MSRILDDLPLVIPTRMHDQENSIVYQHGFRVGFKGQYAGVSSGAITVCFN
jgi:transmembrane 9 superfamily protein 2/4